MRFRRRRGNAIVRGAMALAGLAALVGLAKWGWRSFPEALRYVRMSRM